MKSVTRFNKNKKGLECLNCTQPLDSTANFCSYCGQVNDTKPLSIKQFVTELLGGFFAFDTRSFRTLIPLILKPGEVTKAYISGQRMKYVNPFQLYLHTSIVFFLVTSIFIKIDDYNDLNRTDSKKIDSIVKNKIKDKNITFNFDDGLYVSLNKVPEKKESLLSVNQQIINTSKALIKNAEFLELVKDTNRSDEINDFIDNELNQLYNQIQKQKDSLANYDQFKEAFLTNVQYELNAKQLHYKIDKSAFETGAVISSNPSFKKYNRFVNSKTKNVYKALDSLGYKKTAKNIFWYRKLHNLKHTITDSDAQSSFFANMYSKLSIVLFFLLPLFTLFVHLVYIRRTQNYTENLIFVFNVQTVFFIFLLITLLFDRIFDINIGTNFVFVIGFLIYLYKALRNFYEQGRWKTIFKLILLNLGYLLLSIIGSILIVFLAFIV